MLCVLKRKNENNLFIIILKTLYFMLIFLDMNCYFFVVILCCYFYAVFLYCFTLPILENIYMNNLILSLCYHTQNQIYDLHIYFSFTIKQKK